MFAHRSYQPYQIYMFLLFLLLPHSTKSQSRSSCPVQLPTPTPTANLRIVNGDPAPFLAPYLVALGTPSFPTFTFQCSAVLISSRHILTAAHCAPSQSTPVSLIATAAANGIRATISSVHYPPAGLSNSSLLEQDLALITLSSPAPSAASFALLPPPTYVPLPNTFARVAGYGDIAFQVSNRNNVLHSVDIPVNSPTLCTAAYPGLPDNRICAGYPEGGCDSCQGDSGGPLFQYDPEGRPVVIALVTAGFRCAFPGFPGIYMMVGGLKQWLRDQGAQFDEAEQIQQVWWSGARGQVEITPSPGPTGIAMTPSPSPVPGETRPPTGALPPSLPERTQGPTPSQKPVQVTVEDAQVEDGGECDPLSTLVGGRQLDEVMRKAMVGFTNTSVAELKCSGVVLSQRWVLTTGRCGVQPGWTAWVGAEQSVPTVVEAVRTRGGDRGIAAVRIGAGVGRGSGIRINTEMGIPRTSAVGRGAGFATAGRGGRIGLNVETLNAGRCGASLEAKDGVFCAQRAGGGGPCQLCHGDEGGALVLVGSRGEAVLVGIAVAVSRKCGMDERAWVFARVGERAAWLQSKGVDFSKGVIAQEVEFGRAELKGRSEGWLWVVISASVGSAVVAAVAIVIAVAV